MALSLRHMTDQGVALNPRFSQKLTKQRDIRSRDYGAIAKFMYVIKMYFLVKLQTVMFIKRSAITAKDIHRYIQM